LIHKPVILFLDEPTTGVDAVSRKEFWEMLQALKQQGITILVSTPYMDEASLCDRVALMQDGKLMTIGTPEQIKTAFLNTILAIKSGNMFQLLSDLSQWKDVKDVYSFGEFLHAVMKDGFNIQQLQQYLEEKGHVHAEYHKVEPDIEDCFMQLMRKDRKSVV